MSVLSPPSDCQRYLIVGNDSVCLLVFIVQDDTHGFGRAQGTVDKNFRLAAPVDDIDLFVVEFFNDGLYPHALQTHAGTHGIDAFIVGKNSHFGSVSGKTGHSLDLDDAVVNLRHFDLKQPDEELRRCTRHDDLRAPVGLRHLFDDGPDGIPTVPSFVVNLFRSLKTDFHMIDGNENLIAIDLSHIADNDLPDPVLELVEEDFFFGFPYFLIQSLLGRRDETSSEARRIDDLHKFIV